MQTNELPPSQNQDVPRIESMESVLTRQVWNAPQRSESIQMDTERAQQVSLELVSILLKFTMGKRALPEFHLQLPIRYKPTYQWNVANYR